MVLVSEKIRREKVFLEQIRLVENGLKNIVTM
jgi:hypothetical protein